MPRHLRERIQDRTHPLPPHTPRCEPSHSEILEYLEDISERLARIEEKTERD